jgi:RNA polymerase sigma-70 factor (ECF subfamily)
MVHDRLRHAIDTHYELVHRTLRRLGLSDDEVEDAAQDVFFLFSRRLDSIEAGDEAGFLYRTAVHKALHLRRAFARRRETAADVGALRAVGADPEALTDQRHMIALLDRALRTLPDDLATVLVLCELEEMPMCQVAQILDIPPGTVASRLRRARAALEQALRRLVETV